MREGRPPARRATPAVALVSALLAISPVRPAGAQPTAATCGSLQNAYGPLDYRKDRGEDLHRVEIAHFTPEVEALIKGFSGYLGGDLDYTLRAYPNHHRALVSLVKWGQKTKSSQPPTLPRTIECYFERAIRFRPDDLLVRMIYADFLNRANRQPEAERQLETAAAGAEDNAFTHYNIGLLYLDMKNFDKALREAQIAYALGFNQPALRDALKGAGKWVEPALDAASAVPAAAAASASP